MWECECDKGRLVSSVVVFTTCFQCLRRLLGELLELSRCKSGGQIVDCLEWSGGGSDEVAHPVGQLGDQPGTLRLLHGVHWRAWGELHFGYCMCKGR